MQKKVKLSGEFHSLLSAWEGGGSGGCSKSGESSGGCGVVWAVVGMVLMAQGESGVVVVWYGVRLVVVEGEFSDRGGKSGGVLETFC